VLVLGFPRRLSCGIIASVWPSHRRWLIVLPLLLLSTACGYLRLLDHDRRPPAEASSESPLGSLATAPPIWRPGDRWTFEWRAGTDTGTKSATVLETHDVGGVPYYVVRVGDVEHYYTADLQWAFAVRGSKVEARSVPPKPWFTWPLEAGRRWHHRASFEHQGGRVAELDTFRVVGVEPVVVPAGRFQALRIVREGQAADTDEYWYVPQIRWYVRWVGRRADLSFEERLQSYDPVPR
jgi:hypothetical protein